MWCNVRRETRIVAMTMAMMIIIMMLAKAMDGGDIIQVKETQSSAKPNTSVNIQQHAKRETYSTCKPKSSQTGFQSALCSPASTLLQTSTIMVVAVSISKQHCALFVSLTSIMLLNDTLKTHLNPSSNVINH